MQSHIFTTVSDLCGRTVHITGDSWDRDRFVSSTHIRCSGVVHAVTHTQHSYSFILAVEREIDLDGVKRKVRALETFWLGDGTGIVLADPPSVQSGSIDEIAPHLTSEDTSRPCPKCGARVGSRCHGSRGPVADGYMHRERQPA